MTQMVHRPPNPPSPPVRGAGEQGEPNDRRWTREEYERLVDLGVFDGERVELFEGRIYQMPAMKVPHALALELVDRFVRRAFPHGFRVRVQMPLRAGDGSNPEPDLAVVAGDPRDATTHPATAVLIVEVSDTTVRHDREKARAYAASGVGDYWLLNIVDRRLELHRDPSPTESSSSPPYASVRVRKPEDVVSPLAAPNATVTVAELLP